VRFALEEKRLNSVEKDFYEQIHRKFWGNYRESGEIAKVSIPRLLAAKKIIMEANPKRVLNVGFESATVASSLLFGLNVEEYFLVDIDANSIMKAKDVGFKAVTIDVSRDPLPFPDGHFDLVYMGEVIEHLLNPDFAIREMYRVTKTHGKVIITTPNLACWYNRILLLAGMTPLNVEVSSERIVGRKFKFLGNGSPPVGHIRVFTKGAMTEFLLKEGIHDFKIRGYERGDIPFDKVLSKFPSIASGLIVEIMKR
jgi:SAM-dependent methyltransferase